MSECFEINGSEVSREVFDDEVIVVDFLGGFYYSLDSTATDIWKAMEKGLSRAEIVNALRREYLGELQEIEAGVNQLLDTLLKENVVISVPAASAPANDEGSTPGQLAPQRPFRMPVLSKFTDMQDLLLLDPIHDVDNTGWPARK
jgi:hypothetical protein